MCLFQMMRLNIKIFGILMIAIASAISLPAAAQAPSYDEAQLVRQAEQAIKKIKTLQADFVQISSDGSIGEGVLYFRRPTQLRLEYQNPETLTLVTSKVWLYVDDKIARSVQAIPLGQTPLAPILEEAVSFRSKDFQTKARASDGIAIITMIREEGEAAGQLDLEFDMTSWQLRRWVITDVLGVKTSVTLQNPVFDRKLANKLFGVPGYATSSDN